jgi:hypothetical protein
VFEIICNYHDIYEPQPEQQQQWLATIKECKTPYPSDQKQRVIASTCILVVAAFQQHVVGFPRVAPTAEILQWLTSPSVPP